MQELLLIIMLKMMLPLVQSLGTDAEQSPRAAERRDLRLYSRCFDFRL